MIAIVAGASSGVGVLAGAAVVIRVARRRIRRRARRDYARFEIKLSSHDETCREHLEAALGSAYRDIRIGRDFSGEPQPIRGQLRQPAHVERFRKQRLFVYPVGRNSQNARPTGGAPLMELVARAQAARETTSSVRLQFTPAPHTLERLAGWLIEHQENRSARAEPSGATGAGLRSQYRRSSARQPEPHPFIR